MAIDINGWDISVGGSVDTVLLSTLEKGLATHSSIVAQENSMDRGAWWAIVHGGHKLLDTTEHLLFQQQNYIPWEYLLHSKCGSQFFRTTSINK